MSKPEFPTVATIIGCPEQLNTNGLVATPILPGNFPPSGIPDDTSQVKDPIQRAVLDNICGKLPTKTTVEGRRCEICNIECNGDVSFKIHLEGTKHQKKVRDQKLRPFATLPCIIQDSETGTYQCTACNIFLNAIGQVEAHVAGAKHKKMFKNAPEELEPIETLLNQRSEEVPERPPEPLPKPDPNELFCALCNVRTNSRLQLAQHVVSQKHLTRQKSVQMGRFNPYAKNFEPPPPVITPKNNSNDDPFSNVKTMSLGTSAQSTPRFKKKKTEETSMFNENDEFRW